MTTLHVIGRVVFGLYFLYSGYVHFKNQNGYTSYAKSKGVPSPKLAVLISGAMLIVGGLGLVFDMHLRSSALLLILFLVPTTFMMHDFWRSKDPMHKASEKVSFTKNVALIAALLMFF